MTGQAQRTEMLDTEGRSQIAVNCILQGLRTRSQGRDDDLEFFRNRFDSALWRFESLDRQDVRAITEAAEGMQRKRAQILSDAKGILLEALEHVAPQIGSDAEPLDGNASSIYDDGLSEVEREERDILNAIAVLERYQEQHRLIAHGLRHRIAITRPATSEGDTLARNLLWFDIFKICCEALGLHWRTVRMSDNPDPHSDKDGYLIQCLIRDSWEIYCGQVASEKTIASAIRDQKKNKVLRKKTPRSAAKVDRNRGSKSSPK
ncbi:MULTISPECIES: hypothetical protein [Rhizobium]|uniref:hypothetical protein n=1 Tax=Rhizobium TaxID=379 RepID=UPI001B32994C|nr:MULTISPECIES: hypothetical protein [Rhizobium]MBX4909050.1 hypothetical protein [Rhizobium bangladeshense]MBX5231856.1 hypothetical protein [Rhizobium sp. NLR4a]MBX5258182.1 hypothetical protein [Rhizobium sp. NLR16b]MBX5264275.1 hypothetical protein [Rhizobium sp. NLR16a]MBX5269987.1 hypothetical protein [Rhizobium sp. NLR17b]